MIVRLRLGCAEAALPFLASTGLGGRPIERSVAHKLLAGGATAKAVCSGDFNVEDIASGQTTKIVTQVKRFILSSFETLKDEFVFATKDEENDDVAGNYWQFAEKLIGVLINHSDCKMVWPNRSKETRYTSTNDPASEEATPGPFVDLVEDELGLRLTGYKIEWKEDKPVSKAVLHWYVQVVTKPDEVRPAPEGFTNIIIDFPWLLSSFPVGGEEIRMSPAAFGILLTLLARRFLAEPIVALETLGSTKIAISSEVLLNELYPHLVMKQVPEPIFDAWAGYWDAE